jgi:hypothetical protein
MLETLLYKSGGRRVAGLHRCGEQEARMMIFPFLLAVAMVLPLSAAASDREWGRVGRIVELHGDVSLFDPERDEWTEALRNRPLTEGDRLVLARGARAEIRIAGATLLLAQGADIEVQALDDNRIRLELNKGSLALSIPSRNLAEQTEIRTRETRLRPQRAGRYRIDRDDDSTFAAALRGDLESSGPGHLLLISTGERHEIWLQGDRDDRRDGARSRPARMPDDRLAAWADEAFRTEDRRADSWRYASPDIPGIEELDHHGRWDSHPEYGAVWLPAVHSGWQPFRDGRWIWTRPWGWTWVDAQPWGFAPSYYGRWVSWRGRWCWWPGPRHARPVFAPAVVAWVGGPNVSVGVRIGHAPPAAWVPLAPYQPYVPIVRPHPPKPRPPKYPPQVPTGPISKPPMPAYGPQGVPVGVQPVPQARPVPTAPVMKPPHPMQVGPLAPVTPAAPIAQPAPMAPVAQPVPAAPVAESRGKSAAPFSAPPERAEKIQKQDTRADQRRRDQTQ